MAGDEVDRKDAESAYREQAEAAARDKAEQGGEADQELGADDAGAAGDDIEARIQEAVDAALAEQRDALLRAQAEMQNMRRRCEQDVERAHKYALERFGGELLVVVDNLERALQAVPEQEREKVSALYEGIELTLKGFLETLARHHIEQINPEGEPFDPQVHEAMVTQPSSEVEPNTVLNVVQKGYTLNGRVIRPARVIVSKAAE